MVDLENESGVDCGDISNPVKGGGDCCRLDSDHIVSYDVGFDFNDDDYEDRMIRLFDQVVRVFLNAAAVKGCCRPIPALIGDEQSLDLVKLFWVVRERGGFDMVNGFWSFVAKELGLKTQFAASIKLVYFKYLYELERWMRRNCRDEKLGNLKNPSGGSFGFLSPDVERKFRSLLSLGHAKKRKDGSPTLKKNGRNTICLSDNKGAPRVSGTNDVKRSVDNEKICYDHDAVDVMILDPKTAKKEFNFRKRKRESLSEMLNWIINVARCPDNSSVGKIPPISKWKDHGSKELWIQAIRAKDVLLPKRRDDSKPVQSLLQINQKMHPSMYEDTRLFGNESAERLRCREQLPASVKPRLCSSTSCSTPQTKLANHSNIKSESDLKEQECAAGDLSGANTASSPSGIEYTQKQVPVGPRFQAYIPKWSETVYECDSKWLGTQIWPLEYGKRNVPAESDCTGKGRPDTCGCQHPGLTGCVGFHIAERRMRLKLELGSAFFSWKFDRMGEEVSLRWTTEEEKRFKDMVKFNPPSLGECFWDDVQKYFPRKTREDLVSYYFNVFVARRRCYQNRVTPKDIDSDDDNSDFGSLSNCCGNEVLEIPGDNMLSCLENKQCTDFT